MPMLSADTKTLGEQVFKQVGELVDAWCERRCLNALRFVLQGWPLSNLLTDGWGDLLKALENVRAFAAKELTEQDAQKLADSIVKATKIVYRTSR